MTSQLNCLVTGASGYIGGRLVPELLSAGYAVRCMARDPAKLSDRPWSDDVEIAVADVLDESAVRRALDSIDVAYYLIHSLGTDTSFERRDRTAAQTFAAAAKAAGVQRIVYLGGIISGQAGKLSPHLRSRAEVGDILLASGVPTAALSVRGPCTPSTRFSSKVQDAWTGSAERAAVAVRGALTVELDRSNPPFRAGWAPYLRMVRR